MDERERLLEIMKSYGLNSKQLSLELGVSAGSISNIMGGRNKPSLEFLQNVYAHFPAINSAWLFIGGGEMFIDGHQPTEHKGEQDLFSHLDHTPSIDTVQDNDSVPAHIPTHSPINSSNEGVRTVSSPMSNSSLQIANRMVQKIVIFYSDGTYEER